ncbi:hypothetical protein WJX77_004964 [Trebouxia sp. C0004]
MDKIASASLSTIKEGQKALQQAHAEKGFIHLVGKTDRVTSVMIPLAFTAVGLFVGGKGLYHMYTGTGKLE